MDTKLKNIDVPWQALHCKNSICSKHCTDVQQFHDDIISACIESSKQTIPYSSDKKRKVIPGWNDYVEKYRKDANFWHYIWKCNNSPRVGTLSDIRKSTRAKYHYALRYIKKNQEMCTANRLADSMANNRGRDFWSEVKKIRNSRSSRSSMIDGECDPIAIGSLFSEKYNTLYNSVPYDHDEMEMLKQKLNSLILDSNEPDDMVSSVSPGLIAKGVQKLKKR